MPVGRPGNALDEQRQLFILVKHATLEPVGQRIGTHGARIDDTDRTEEFSEPFRQRSLAGAENAFVLAGEGIAEVVLKQAARADNDWRLAEVLEHVSETFDEILRELARQKLFAGAFDALGEFLLLGLRHAVPPAVVFDQVGVEDVRANIERIMGLKLLPCRRKPLAQDGASQEHAQRFASDLPRSDHALPDLDQIRQGEVLANQSLNTFFAGNREIDELIEHGGGLFVGYLAAALGDEHLFAAHELLVPVADQSVAGRRQPRPGSGVQYFGDVAALLDRGEVFALPFVQQEKRWREAADDFLRLDVQTVARAMDVKQDLRRFGDWLGGVVAMVIAQYREIGDRLHFVQVRPGEFEEIADHPIREATEVEIGHEIENVVPALPFACDALVDARHELFESLEAFERLDNEARCVSDRRLVVSETEVDDGFVAGDGMTNE